MPTWSDDPFAPPTQVRHQLLLFLGSLSFVLYLDRVCLGQALKPISEELQISETGMGWILGAFTLAYGLFEVPTGHWGDRFGSRRVLTRIVLWWSTFTILTGLVPAFSLPLPIQPFASGAVLAFDSFVLLFVVRFLFGAGEAGALPNVARVVSRWFPQSERPLAQAVVLTSMLLGGAAAPVLAGFLIEKYGWRVAFGLFGLVGVAWAWAFSAWFRDDPADHPAVNAAERALILQGREAPGGARATHSIPWQFVLSSRNVWLLGAIMSCGASCSYFYMGWYPSYLQKGRGVSAEDSKWLASLVMVGGATGALLGSVLGGIVDRWQYDNRWKRCLTGFGLFASAAICLTGSLYCESPRNSTLLVALAFCFAQAQQPTWWTVVAAISGRHLGALFGLMNSMGVPGAFFANVFTGWLVDQRKAQGAEGRVAWDGVYPWFIGILMLGALFWLFVDLTRSAVEPDAETASDLATGRVAWAAEPATLTAQPEGGPGGPPWTPAPGEATAVRPTTPGTI